MSKLILEITTSLDGYVAGPDASLDEPLGKGGEKLHGWVFKTLAWRRAHGLEGGENNPDSELVQTSIDATGSVVMGRRMFSGGAGSWSDDPNADGWWGEDPPFHVPVFILTHHPRETVVKEGDTRFTFVTDGIEAALEQARAAAGVRDVFIGGGADVAQQYLRAGLVDEVRLHVAPLFLGGGVRLLDGLGPRDVELMDVISSPDVAHLTFRPAKGAEQ